MGALSDDMRKEASKLSKWGRPTATNLLRRGADELDKRKARIEALEAQVRAADALIEDLLQHEGAEGFSHSTYELEAAYTATKEGGA